MKRFLAPYAESNQILINESGRFRAVDLRGEIFSDHPAVWRTLLLGDLDNDGDQDCLATSVGEPVRVFANLNESKGQWLQLRLIMGCDINDSARTRDDVGAVAAVHSGKQIWRRIVQPGTGYLSSHDTRIHFGLGRVTQIDHIDVIWSDGKQERFPTQRLNQIATLRKGSGS